MLHDKQKSKEALRTLLPHLQHTLQTHVLLLQHKHDYSMVSYKAEEAQAEPDCISGSSFSEPEGSSELGFPCRDLLGQP